MKHLFTFLIATVISVGANAQTIYFSDDFEGGSLTGNNAWTTYEVSNPDALNTWVLGTVAGNYAKQSNYVSGNHVLDSWLISPAIDLSSATAPNMKFDNTRKFPGDDIKVMLSTDYSGSGDPTGATWADITSLFTLDTDNSGYVFVASGDGDLSSYSPTATTYIAFEYIGTASDGSTWEVDNIVIQEGPTVIDTVTIYDIQYTTLAGDSSTYTGQNVVTSGIVTGIYQVGTAQYSFFIQDGDGAWNGIYVFETGNTSLALGDSLWVSATVDEFNTLTELKNVTNITVQNSGNNQPNAVVVTNANIADEMYEGVVVELDAAICQTAPDQYGAWTASDGSGTIKVDDDLLPATFAAVVGDGYYAFGENLLLPRSSAEIVTVGYNGIEENQTVLMVYPNPAENAVTVKAEPNSRVVIYSATGSIVAVGMSNETINVSGLESGVYMVNVNAQGINYTERLIIK